MSEALGMSPRGFIFGIEGLDRSFKDVLQPPLLLTIAGHPGSGKTTFGSTICYTNSVASNAKCLYISFQEDKERFYRFMKSIGMDFGVLEEKGVFRFIKIPITLDVDTVIENISAEVSRFQPKIVVVDSVTAVMQGVKDDRKRAWIQNYFYELSRAIHGIIVLIAEIPFGEEVISSGSIEFVSDALFILKYRIEQDFLTRYIEVRKTRGIPITIAEIPFTISSNGLRVWMPPILSDIRYYREEIPLHCRILKSIIGSITKGSIIYIEYPPDFRVSAVLLIPVAIAYVNNLNILVISYRYPPLVLEHLVREALVRVLLSEDIAAEVIRRCMQFKGVNPFSQSLVQSYAEEIEYVERARPDIVAFHGIELVTSVVDRSKYISRLYNELNTLKSFGCTIVRFASYINEELSNINSAMADIVVRIIPVENDSGYQRYKFYIWRSGREAYIMTYEEVLECLHELGEVIKSRHSSIYSSPQQI